MSSANVVRSVRSRQHSRGATARSRGRSCMRESLRIRETCVRAGDRDADAPTVAVTQTGLGGLLERKGDLVEAERSLRRSIAIRDRAHDHGYAFARTMTKLGNVLAKEGRAAEAEPIDRGAVIALEKFVDQRWALRRSGEHARRGAATAAQARRSRRDFSTRRGAICTPSRRFAANSIATPKLPRSKRRRINAHL